MMHLAGEQDRPRPGPHSLGKCATPWVCMHKALGGGGLGVVSTLNEEDFAVYFAVLSLCVSMCISGSASASVYATYFPGSSKKAHRTS